MSPRTSKAKIFTKYRARVLESIYEADTNSTIPPQYRPNTQLIRNLRSCYLFLLESIIVQQKLTPHYSPHTTNIISIYIINTHTRKI